MSTSHGSINDPLVSQSKQRRGVSAAFKSCMPILEWLPAYNLKSNLLPDVSGAITLGCILMGQSLAHADLCKVNLINGPYSCMLPPILYSLFGTCVHASVGTGGLVSLLTGEQLMKYGDDIEYRTRVGAILTLLVGLFMFLMGVCRLAFLVRFLSRPALSGFITASALLIILSQLAPLLGLPPWASKGGIVYIVIHHFNNMDLLNVNTLVMSVVALGFLMNAKRFKPIWFLRPLSDFKELILLISTACFCKWFNAHLEDDALRITVVGSMPSGLPSFAAPVTMADMHLVKELIPGAVLVALVVFLSSFAGAKKFAMMDGYQVVAFNELVALGMANIVGAFNGSVPTQVGLSRMGIAHGAGVRTQLGSNVFVGFVVGGITYAFSAYLYNVPKCVLNCIIVNGASHLTEFDEAQKLYQFAIKKEYNWKCRMDIVVWCVGFLCTLYFGAFEGILMAVFMSLCLILYQVVNPDIAQLGYKATTQNDSEGRARMWVNRSHVDAREENGILVFRLEGPLFYANVESVQEWLEEREVLYAEETGETYKGIILSASAVSFVDTSAMSTLGEMMKSYAERGVLFFVANTFGQVGRLMADTLEQLEKKTLKSDELKEKLSKCSSIDDYVALINENSEAVGKRMPLLRGGSLCSEQLHK